MAGGAVSELPWAIQVAAVYQNLGRRRIQANFDLYNVFNSNPVLAAVNTFTQNVNTNRWLQPTQILDSRLVKFSGQIDF